MLKKWLVIRDFYVQSSHAISYKGFMQHGRFIDLLPFLSALCLTISASAILYFFELPLWSLTMLFGVAVSMLVSFWGLERFMKRAYSAQYQRHDISRQNFWERFDALTYAIFLEKIETQRPSAAELDAIAKYSETLAPPPKPFLINQHFIMVILISVTTGLFTASIQKTNTWLAHNGVIVVFAFMAAAVIASIILDGLRTSTTRDARIRRFLIRAKIELEFNPTVELGTESVLLLPLSVQNLSG